MYIVVSLVSAGRARSGVTDTASSLTLAQWWETMYGMCTIVCNACYSTSYIYMHSVGEVFIAQWMHYITGIR